MNDTPGNLDQSLRGNLLVLRIVTGALITGVLVLVGFSIVQRSMEPQPPKQPVIGLVGVIFAAAALVAAAVVPNFIRRSWERQVAAGTWPAQPAAQGRTAVPATPVDELTPEQETLRWWTLYQTTHIIRCATVEGAALLQGVAYLVEGNLFSLAVGIGLLGVLATQWPGRERIDRWVEARREAVEQMRGGGLP